MCESYRAPLPVTIGRQHQRARSLLERLSASHLATAALLVVDDVEAVLFSGVDDFDTAAHWLNWTTEPVLNRHPATSRRIVSDCHLRIVSFADKRSTPQGPDRINPMRIQSAAVIGTGMMGPGIATILALGGVPVTILSRSAESAEDARQRAAGFLALLQEHGLAPAECASIVGSADLDSVVPQVDLVIESAPENMEFKQSLFQHLDSIAKPGAILASNTSGLSITAIASKCTKPERVVTTHFWNPPHLVPLVEIVRGQHTSLAVAEELRALLTRCGKTPVMVKKDTPGQLGNRIQSAMIRECINILEQGIADVEDIDLAVRNGFGMRLPEYGPFEHADAVGLDLGVAIADYVTRDLSNRVGASDSMKERVARGDLGVKSGKGFYDWSQKSWSEVRARRDGFVLDVVKRRARNILDHARK